jgi:hypothetical protein
MILEVDEYMNVLNRLCSDLRVTINSKFMAKVDISINPLAEFIQASSRRKRSIVKQQLNPPTVMVARYRTARSHIRKSVMNGFSPQEIVAGVSVLQKRQPKTKFAQSDIKNSIEALRFFLDIKFPEMKDLISCHFYKSDKKSFELSGVNIIVAPDLILRYKKNGIDYLGGIKFHISKDKSFSYKGAQVAAYGIMSLIEKEVVKKGEIVDPMLCLSIDVFGQRVMNALNIKADIPERVENACEEIKAIIQSL